MSNSWFRFKHFTVNQDRCAMKVCTDACLFGAWAAQLAADSKVDTVLDIGAGTGLLSLMVAQATNATIDAVELDKAAAKQAGENFSQSPWTARLRVFSGDIRNIFLENKYDLVISNPPFFSQDLKSPDTRRNLALHSEELALDELTGRAKELLTENGYFAVLLPCHRKEEFEAEAGKSGFHIAEVMLAKQTPAHSPFRAMFWCTRKESERKTTEIIIKEGNDYTPPFSALLKPYYLAC